MAGSASRSVKPKTRAKAKRSSLLMAATMGPARAVGNVVEGAVPAAVKTKLAGAARVAASVGTKVAKTVKGAARAAASVGTKAAEDARVRVLPGYMTNTMRKQAHAILLGLSAQEVRNLRIATTRGTFMRGKIQKANLELIPNRQKKRVIPLTRPMTRQNLDRIKAGLLTLTDNDIAKLNLRSGGRLLLRTELNQMAANDEVFKKGFRHTWPGLPGFIKLPVFWGKLSNSKKKLVRELLASRHVGSKVWAAGARGGHKAKRFFVDTAKTHLSETASESAFPIAIKAAQLLGTIALAQRAAGTVRGAVARRR